MAVNKKGKKITEAKFGTWGPVPNMINYPLSDGTIYNPSKISIETFRKMREDYQINACLNVLSFTIQKINWYIDSDDKKIKDFLEYAIKKIWPELVRYYTKAFWAGYSPAVKVFTMDEKSKKIIYKRIKDLAPETCRVRLKGDSFNGFRQEAFGNFKGENIPAEVSLWYTNDMEDGNYYGRSRLTSAYNPWYYSELIHLFANRYYERFAEPVVVGRAPNETVEDDSEVKKNAMDLMQATVDGIKSHSSITIPSELDENGNQLYDIKYLESQMRGSDFDKYLDRLDMEKARALFVPDLLLGSGKVGSYELGKEHKATFLSGLMSSVDTMFLNINKYVLPQLVELNFGVKTKDFEIKYLPISKVNEDNIINIVTAMVNGKMIRPSTKELADVIGIPLEEVEEITAEPTNNGDISNKPVPEKKPEVNPDDKQKIKDDITQKQMLRLENAIKKAINDGATLDAQYDNLEKIKLTHIGKIADNLGEEEVSKAIEKQSKIIISVLDGFTRGESVTKLIRRAEYILTDGQMFARESDFIDASRYMPQNVKDMAISFRNLFVDTFKDKYDETKNIFVSQKTALDAVERAYNEHVLDEVERTNGGN
jgi:hypothetical protein